MYVAGEECRGRRGRKEGVYVAGGVLRKEREERGSVCRGRSAADGEGGERACMSQEECHWGVCQGSGERGRNLLCLLFLPLLLCLLLRRCLLLLFLFARCPLLFCLLPCCLLLREERGREGGMSRERSVAEGEGGERACMSRARKGREERGRVCCRRSVTGEYVKEAVRGGETSSVFFFSPSSSAFFFAAASSSSFFFLRAAPSSSAFCFAA